MTDKSPKSRRPLSIGATLLIAAAILLYTQVGPWVSNRFNIELPGIPTPQSTADGGAQNSDTGNTPDLDASGNADSRTTKNRNSDEGKDTTAVQPRKFPKNNAAIDDFPPGGLKSYGDIKVSPAGLRYTKSSNEHRLDHVMRHAKNALNRPVHGVFDGDQAKVIATIDEAYLKAQAGGRGVQREQDRNRTAFTVELNRRVGYVGGQKGQRNGNPPCTKVKLILEDKNVITAYPVD